MNNKDSLEHVCNICDHDCCPYIHYDKSRCGFYGIIRQDLDRLEEYRKIEEEIGMSLNTLFRILKYGQIICKYRPMYESNKIILLSRKIQDLYYDDGKFILHIYETGDDGYFINFDYVYIKDYGKTWSLDKNDLTKEVLENDK